MLGEKKKQNDTTGNKKRWRELASRRGFRRGLSLRLLPAKNRKSRDVSVGEIQFYLETTVHFYRSNLQHTTNLTAFFFFLSFFFFTISFTSLFVYTTLPRALLTFCSDTTAACRVKNLKRCNKLIISFTVNSSSNRK